MDVFLLGDDKPYEYWMSKDGVVITQASKITVDFGNQNDSRSAKILENYVKLSFLLSTFDNE